MAWSVSRDQKLPQMRWEVGGDYKDCHFEATADENLWLIKATSTIREKKDEQLIGALLVYVDDFLVMGEEKMIRPTLQCNYSPTSAGDGPEGGDLPGPIGPTPPSEAEGSGKGSQRLDEEESEGKGGKKGRPR